MYVENRYDWLHVIVLHQVFCLSLILLLHSRRYPIWQTLYPYCGGPSTPPASLLNPSSCTRVRAGPAPLLRNNVRGSSIYGSFWWVFSQAQIFFFAEVLRIAETKLAFFMWGTFPICPIEWFFLILGLRLTLGRNNIVSEGGYRGLSSFSPHIFLALVETRHLGIGRRRMSPAHDVTGKGNVRQVDLGKMDVMIHYCWHRAVVP